MKQRVFAPDLCTDRLILKDITEKEALLIVEWRSNPNVYKYFVSPHKISLEEHLNWFNNKYIYDSNRFDWMGYTKDSEPVGVFGIKRESLDSVTAEISYILSPNHYGKGYAREAIERLILFCKDEWKCKKIIAEIHKDNTASIRFIDRFSFELDEMNGNLIRYVKEL